MALIYRKTEISMWRDARFRKLTPPQPCGQSLWMWLLTGEKTTMIPGLVVGREAELAGAIGWPLDGFREAFAEISREGMAIADWDAGVVVLPKALIDSRGLVRETNKPQSPNVVKAWGKSFDEVPECELKTRVLVDIYKVMRAMGEGFFVAFREAFAKGITRDLPKEFAIQISEAEDRNRISEGAAGDLFGHVEKPKKGQQGKRPKELPLPADWKPNEKHIELAANYSLDLERETERFRNHAGMHDRRVVNWNLAFNNWLLKATEMQPRSNGGGGGSFAPRPAPSNGRTSQQIPTQRRG